MARIDAYWVRRHEWLKKTGEPTAALALVVRSDGMFEATLYAIASGLSGTSTSDRISCHNNREAKTIADGMLLAIYPHDCNAEKCGPWRDSSGPIASQFHDSPVVSDASAIPEKMGARTKVQ